jgi:large subunit ribosomal protein L25
VTDVKLAAVARTEFGKGAARRTRRAHQIPAVLYGHGSDPLHIALPGHETMLALKHSNALLTIELDGKDHLAIVKDVQRDAVRAIIEHVDLLSVKKGEKIAVFVAVHVVGESAAGTIHLVETQTLHVEAEATHLPESIEISIEGLEAGTMLRGADVTFPPGVTYLGDPEEPILAISTPQSADDDEAEAEATTATPTAAPEA